MKLRLLHIAELELNAAMRGYRDKGEDIGERFLVELRIASNRIVETPHAWHPLGNGLRRIRLNRFPYGLIYAVLDNEILIVAVHHHSRRPRRWRDRMSE